MATHALVDGDIVIYRAGFSVDVTLYQVYDGDEHSATPVFETTSSKSMKEFIADNPGNWEVSRSPAQAEEVAALSAAKRCLLDIVDRSGADDLTVLLTGKDNFRDEVATFRKYKGNRDNMRRPLFYNEIKKYLIEVWGAQVSQGHEADDELAIQYKELKGNVSPIICSIDKDLLQIPAVHYNWVNDKYFTIDWNEGRDRFFKQVLVGDNTDNIFGCPGIGAKTADKIIDAAPYDRKWQAVLDTYRRVFTTKKLPDDMRLDDGMLVYNHWGTGKVMAVTPEQYAEEVARLIYIKQSKEDEWPVYLKT